MSSITCSSRLRRWPFLLARFTHSLLEALTGAKISVGAPFFNLTAVPLMIPLFLAMPFGQRLAWKRGDSARSRPARFSALACPRAAGSFIALSWQMRSGGPVLAVLGVALGIFVVLGSLDELRERILRGGVAGALHRDCAGLPRSLIATALAHAGVGLMVIGIACTAFEEERIASLKPGESVAISGYNLLFKGSDVISGPNYSAIAAQFELREGGVKIAELSPAKRMYVGRQMPTSEVARYRTGLSEIYVAIGETSDQMRVDTRIYWKPFVLLIWLGPVLMAIGGLLSLSDRRLRIGAPRRSRTIAVPEPAE